MAVQNCFWQLLAPFTCAAPPSNHHKSCNHNTHFCSTAHLNRTSSSHNTPKTSLLSEVEASTLSSTHRGAHTIAQCLEYPGATQGQTAVMTNHRQKNHRSAPPPRSLLPPPLREQRQRQRRPQRAPIPKNPQPQPLESQHHKRGEGRRL